MEYVAAGQRHLGFTLAECRQGVLLMSHLDVVLIRSEHVLGALDLASMYSLSSWDALILKTASTSGCGRLLTEDMQDGQASTAYASRIRSRSDSIGGQGPNSMLSLIAANWAPARRATSSSIAGVT